MQKRRGRLLIWIIVLGIALGAIKWGLRTNVARAWVTSRMASALAADVAVESMDLRWPGRLSLTGLEVSFVEGGSARLIAREARVGWRPWNRGLLELRRVDVFLEGDGTRWDPPSLMALTRFEHGVPEALEVVSRRFRERWDIHVRDGRILGVAPNASTTNVFARGLNWDCLRVRLPERTVWYQQAELYDWEGGPSDVLQPALFAWMAFGDGAGIVAIERVEARTAPPPYTDDAPEQNRPGASDDPFDDSF